MSLVDVSAAVLLLFADPPLLSTHDGRFAAVGRLLIAILISISVFSRCVFAITICALLASSVRHATHPLEPLLTTTVHHHNSSALVWAAFRRVWRARMCSTWRRCTAPSTPCASSSRRVSDTPRACLMPLALLHQAVVSGDPIRLSSARNIVMRVGCHVMWEG